MATQKQIRANRLNAQRCTGPSSVEGKARSSWNALKSGIHAESEILPWEDPAERAILRDEYHNHHQPVSPEERSLVDNLVHGEFLSRRFRRSEVKIVVSKLPGDADLSDDAVIGQAYIDASAELGRLQRRMDTNNRTFHRDLDRLRLLKAERPPFEPPPPLVLLPPQPAPPPPDPGIEHGDEAPAEPDAQSETSAEPPSGIEASPDSATESPCSELDALPDPVESILLKPDPEPASSSEPDALPDPVESIFPKPDPEPTPGSEPDALPETAADPTAPKPDVEASPDSATESSRSEPDALPDPVESIFLKPDPEPTPGSEPMPCPRPPQIQLPPSPEASPDSATESPISEPFALPNPVESIFPKPDPEPAPGSESAAQPKAEAEPAANLQAQPSDPVAVVAEGLKALVGRLSENFTPHQLTGFTVRTAAEVYRFRHQIPTPRPAPEPNLSTGQPNEPGAPSQ